MPSLWMKRMWHNVEEEQGAIIVELNNKQKDFSIGQAVPNLCVGSVPKVLWNLG